MRGLLSNQQAMSACLSSELLSPRLCRGFFHASSSTQKKERPLAGLATASPLLTLTHSRGVLGSVDSIYSCSLTTWVGYRTLRSFSVPPTELSFWFLHYKLSRAVDKRAVASKLINRPLPLFGSGTPQRLPTRPSPVARAASFWQRARPLNLYEQSTKQKLSL